MSAHSIPVPFVQIGNRRGLTDEQIEDMPWVAGFFNRFRHRFERAQLGLDAWVYIEPWASSLDPEPSA